MRAEGQTAGRDAVLDFTNGTAVMGKGNYWPHPDDYPDFEISLHFSTGRRPV